MNIWSLPKIKEEAVRLLQQRGILHTQRKCKNGHDLKRKSILLKSHILEF